LLVLVASLFPVTAVFAGDDDGDYEFSGYIESLPDTPGWIGDWVVSGRTVHVTDGTQIKQENGAVALGAYVEVKGWLQADGSVDAIKIEVKSGADNGDEGDFKFYGTVESLPADSLIGDWTVSGQTVRVDAATRIEQEHGQVAIGAYVEVKGWLQADGSIKATKIEVKMGAGGEAGTYMKFYGTIESLPASGLTGDWQVSGRTVHVDAATRIEQEHGPVAVGAYVEVKGWLQADDSINATKIEVKEVGDGHTGNGYVKFYGIVKTLPAGGLIGDWMVDQRMVHVDAATRIEQEHGPVAPGAYVEVRGWLQADDSVNATEIEVKDSPGSGEENVKFEGTIEQLPDGTFIGSWVVSGRTVLVNEATRINQEHGAVAVGAYVEIEGRAQADGSIIASKVEVKSGPDHGTEGYVKFYGVVEDLPATGLVGDWLVSGRVVHVTDATRIEEEHGAVRIGASVEVKGMQQADGSIDAMKIEVKS